MKVLAARSVATLLSCLALSACGDDSAQVPTRTPPTLVPNPSTPTPPPPAPNTPPLATQGMTIGAPMTAKDLVAATLMLVQLTDRAGLAATSTDGLMFQLVLPPDADATRATALARALGNVTTASIAWPPTAPLFTLEVDNIRGGTTLHLAPNSTAETIAVLPDGTLFVVFVGTFAGGASAREGEGAWAYGQDSSGRSGWVRGASLAVEEGCILGRDALAGALSLRLDDERLRLGVLGNIHIYRGGQRKRGSFFIMPSSVALLERPSNCRSATLDTQIDTDMPVEELHHARDQENGNTFLALALTSDADPGAAHWLFYPPTSNEASVDEVLSTHWTTPTRQRDRVTIAPRRGPANARGYWAFSIKRPGADAVFYTSDGAAFSEFSTEVAPAPAPTPAP